MPPSDWAEWSGTRPGTERPSTPVYVARLAKVVSYGQDKLRRHADLIRLPGYPGFEERDFWTTVPVIQGILAIGYDGPPPEPDVIRGIRWLGKLLTPLLDRLKGKLKPLPSPPGSPEFLMAWEAILELLESGEPATVPPDPLRILPGAEEKPIRLTPRQEIILAAVEGLGRKEPGPWQGPTIATAAQLDYDSRIRNDLSALCKLGFLDKTGEGYARTSEPSPMS